MTTTPPFTRSLPGIGLIAGIFFASCLVRCILAPLLAPIETDFGISHTTATTLLMSLAIGYATGMVSCGVLSRYVQHKYIIIASVALSGAMLFATSFTEHLWQMRITVFLYSYIAGFYFPSGMAALSTVTPAPHWGKAIAVHETSPNLAYILCPLFAAGMLLFTDWRTTMQVLGIVVVIGSIAFWKYGKGGEYKEKATGNTKALSFLKRPETQMFTVLLSMGIILEQSTYGVISLFLVGEQGMTPSAANGLLAASRLANPATGFLSGWLTDKLGEKPVIYGVLALSGIALILMGFAEGWLLFAALFLQAALPIMFFPALYKAMTNLFPAHEQTTALSVCVPIGCLVALGIVPLIMGIFGDTIGFRAGFIALAVLALGCIAIVPKLFPKQVT